ncbi:MAG: GrpB family protein [Chloroflexi bacterium]|nr:GrpB family protein [Chloroflexota bacterium]
MLTPEQEAWIAHLSDTDRVRIVPYDALAPTQFDAVRQRIRMALGDSLQVEHHGASSFGISGQDEIDIYVPVVAERLASEIDRFQLVFGPPQSNYPGLRARFSIEECGKRVDVFVINGDHDNWRQLQQFEGYLRAHPDELERYRLLKEAGDGLTVREYYRRKIEYINSVLDLVRVATDGAGAW